MAVTLGDPFHNTRSYPTVTTDLKLLKFKSPFVGENHKPLNATPYCFAHGWRDKLWLRYAHCTSFKTISMAHASSGASSASNGSSDLAHELKTRLPIIQIIVRDLRKVNQTEQADEIDTQIASMHHYIKRELARAAHRCPATLTLRQPESLLKWSAPFAGFHAHTVGLARRYTR